MNDYLEIRNELLSLADEQYKKFASSLIPNCSNLVGVRIPKLRQIAKRIAKNNPYEYLLNNNEIFFEEVMLKALIIGNLKEDISVVLEYVSVLLPKITNWSLCDSFCVELKIVKHNKKIVWEFINKCFKSKLPYKVRFAVVISLLYFIDDEYIDSLFKIYSSIDNQNYYVKMSIAWAISMCFIKFPDKTMTFFKNTDIDKVIYNKSIQKICDSLQVDKSTKQLIKAMKR